MPSPIEISSAVGRTIIHQGREYRYFSGTAYLGIGNHADFLELLHQAISQYGVNHGLSRVNSLRLKVYNEFEEFFASKAGAEKSLCWSSGFLAGMAAVNFLKNTADHLFVAPDTHPAVLPDGVSPDSSLSFQDWQKECSEKCEAMPASRILFLTNAVDVLTPEIHDFSWISSLPGKHQYSLLIDDSHAFGTVGEDIFGTYKRWKSLPVKLMVSGSLGKGLSLPGGIILGEEAEIDRIHQTAIFRASSPPPPAYLQAFLEAQHIYGRQLAQLKANISEFIRLAGKSDKLKYTDAFPVFTFKPESWVAELEAAGVLISSFPYPGPRDPISNRIIISAAHHAEDLAYLANILHNLQ